MSVLEPVQLEQREGRGSGTMGVDGDVSWWRGAA